MSPQGLYLIFSLLAICFFRESFCICDGTTWTKVGWEIFPEEMHYLKVKPPPSHCLPYPLDKLCCSFANMDIFQGCFHLTYILVQALLLILFVLSAHYLWMKWKKRKKKLKKEASLDTPCNDVENQSLYDVDQILFKLVATTSMMTKYLNQMSHHPPAKKVEHRKLKRKMTEGGEGPRGY
uniref:Testis expressed 50 n=1 Tax=Catagonus wagneri TaxID=51154 RepID=A0A8C3X6G1_9CETA